MKSNNKRAFAVLLGGLMCCLLLAGAAQVKRDPFTLGRSMEVLVNMFRDLNLFYVDEVDTEQMLENAAAGMVRNLDPYTEYISPEKMVDFETLTTGKYAGVGSLIRAKGDYVTFAQPYENSPADRAGIEIGDRIIRIEGRDAKGMTTEQVSTLLKGDPGTTVKLSVEKFYTGKTEEIKLKREIITMPGVPYYGMTADSVGYIQHSDFTEECSRDILKALMSFKQQGAKGMILDLRSNGGGILQEAVKIVSYFTPKGTEVVSTKAKIKENNATFTTDSEPVDMNMPIVVLVNSASASAAEIVSGALQDLDRAVLIGQRTYGKGLVQSPRPLGYDAYLKLTTAKYYLPSGRCIQAIDYTRRNDDGSIAFVPDSLVSEFKTQASRKVYDGGGVMPDIVLPAEYVSRFAYIVYAKNYIADFVDQYALSHREELKNIDLDTFKIDEQCWQQFSQFMADKDVDWESETKATLKLLKQRAEQERYIDAIADQIAKIEKSLKDDDIQSNLTLYRRELSELIEGEMVLRNNYQRGMIRQSLVHDNEVKAAIELLNNPQEYQRILREQDTARK